MTPKSLTCCCDYEIDLKPYQKILINGWKILFELWIFKLFETLKPGNQELMQYDVIVYMLPAPVTPTRTRSHTRVTIFLFEILLNKQQSVKIQ